jgi:hypothetical protein
MSPDPPRHLSVISATHAQHADDRDFNACTCRQSRVDPSRKAIGDALSLCDFMVDSGLSRGALPVKYRWFIQTCVCKPRYGHIVIVLQEMRMKSRQIYVPPNFDRCYFEAKPKDRLICQFQRRVIAQEARQALIHNDYTSPLVHVLPSHFAV